MFKINDYGNCQVLIMPRIRICLAAISLLLHRISPRYAFVKQLISYLFFWTNKNVTVISIFLQMEHGCISAKVRELSINSLVSYPKTPTWVLELLSSSMQ